MSIIYDLPFAEYARLLGWSWSRIKLLETGSPLHVRHGGRTDDTASRAWLRAVHCLALEPHTFEREFSVYDGTRRGKLYDAHCITHPGTTVLNPREHAEALAAATAIRTHADVAPYLAEGRAEVSMTWTDPATGLPCKARIDWLTTSALLDLKTLGTTHERRVASMVAQGLYHGQLAHYAAGLEAHGIDVAEALLVVAEGKGAQDVSVWRLDPAPLDGALYVGRQLRDRLMERLAECVARDEWPGRHQGVQDLVLPGWALDDPAESITFGEEAV